MRVGSSVGLEPSWRNTVICTSDNPDHCGIYALVVVKLVNIFTLNAYNDLLSFRFRYIYRRSITHRWSYFLCLKASGSQVSNTINVYLYAGINKKYITAPPPLLSVCLSICLYAFDRLLMWYPHGFHTDIPHLVVACTQAWQFLDWSAGGWLKSSDSVALVIVTSSCSPVGAVTALLSIHSLKRCYLRQSTFI